MNATLRQSAKLLALFQGTSRDQVQALLESGLLVDLRDADIARITREEFRKFVGLGPLSPKEVIAPFTYVVFVDYGKTIEEMVRLGNYRVVQRTDFTSESFKTQRTGASEVAVELVHLNRSIGIENAIEELNSRGQRPAEIHELLAVGIEYPDVQLEFSVIGAGSVSQGRTRRNSVPCLGSMDMHGRMLSLVGLDRQIPANYRFAAVRKSI